MWSLFQLLWQIKAAAKAGNGTADSTAQAEATSAKPKKARAKRGETNTEDKPGKKKRVTQKSGETIAMPAASTPASAAVKPEVSKDSEEVHDKGGGDNSKVDAEEVDGKDDGDSSKVDAEEVDGKDDGDSSKVDSEKADGSKTKPKRSRKTYSVEEIQSAWKLKDCNSYCCFLHLHAIIYIV